ncbi:hypothetical protein F2Q70_00000539, partial [Brassica cretica]
MVGPGRPQIVLFGSSIVQYSFSNGGWGASLADVYSRTVSHSLFFSSILNLFSDFTADVILRGYGGWNSRFALKVLDQVFPKDAVVQPSLVIVYFGGNDSMPPHPSGKGAHVSLSEFIDNMRKIGEHLLSLSDKTRVIFLSPPPMNERQIQLVFGISPFSALQVLAHGRDSLPHNQPHRHVSCEVSVPVVDDLIVISDKAYTRREVLDMEKLMANTLQFNFCLPTPYVFMRRFLKAAQSNKKVELLSFFIIELCLVEYEMLQCVPSDVPGLFQTRFQTAPLDLDTKSFYLTRKETIESQLEKVANRMAEEMLIISYETHCGTTCRGVAWERFSLEGLKAAVACVGD